MFTFGLVMFFIGTARCAVNEIVIQTPDSYALFHISSYGLFPTNSFITFDVKACNNARIGLLTEDIQMFYEIVIGGQSNTRQYIRRTGNNIPHEADVRDFPGLLNCNEYKTFWISWHAGVIKVGIGSLADDQTVFANWTDPVPLLVDDIGVGTGYGSTGTWVFEKITVDGTSSISPTSMLSDAISSAETSTLTLLDTSNSAETSTLTLLDAPSSAETSTLMQSDTTSSAQTSTLIPSDALSSAETSTFSLSDAINSVQTSKNFDYFCAITGFYSTGQIMYNATEIHSVECAMLCSADDACIGFNFKRLSLKCEFLDTDVEKKYIGEWDFFRKCILVN